MIFITWLWRNGWRPGVYDYRHVNRLQKLLDQYVQIPHKLVCITDDPVGVECETFPLWEFPQVQLQNPREQKHIPNCFVRLKIFDPAVAQLVTGGQQFVSIDLDVIIWEDITDLFVNPPPFKVGVGYTSHVNTSLFTLLPGVHRHVWDDFDVVESPKLIARTMYTGRRRDDIISGSDQAWVSMNIPDPPMWTEADGLYQYLELGPRRVAPENARIIFFAGLIKPWDRDAKMINPRLYTPL